MNGSDEDFDVEEQGGVCGVAFLHVLQGFPANGVMWAFKGWLFSGEAEQSIAADDHSADFASADIAIAFVGEADEISDGIVWASGFAKEQSGREFFGDFVEDGVEVEPAIIGDQGNEWIAGGCILGGLEQPFDGNTIHEDFFAGLFDHGANEQFAVDDAVERDVEAIEEFAAAPVASGFPATEEPAEDCESSGDGNFNTVVAELIADGGEPFVHRADFANCRLRC